jgi:Toprim domain
MQSVLDEYREVARQLNERIEQLAVDLLPNGYVENRRWYRVGSIAGEPGQSLAIELRGTKRGRWTDYAGTDRGDGLDLVAAVRCNGDKREAFRWARDWLNLPSSLQPAALTSRRKRHNPWRSDDGDEDYRRSIQRIWLSAKQLTPADPVSRYLTERGIELAELGRAPRALRYHPQLWNEATGRHWPAMVAAITAPNGAMTAVHRTWLEIDPFGVTKAPITDRHGATGGAKRTLGSYVGGCIHLWRGASKKAWRDMPEDETVVIGEGIEDCLSSVMIEPAWRTVCAVALSSMLGLELPRQVKRVQILGQNDQRHSKAAKLLGRVVQRWRDEGRAVRVARPPAFLKDWNDLLLWTRKHGVTFDIDWGN